MYNKYIISRERNFRTGSLGQISPIFKQTLYPEGPSMQLPRSPKSSTRPDFQQKSYQLFNHCQNESYPDKKKQLMFLLQSQLNNQKKSRQMIENSYQRQINRVKIFIEKIQKRSADMTIQFDSLANERQRLETDVKDIKKKIENFQIEEPKTDPNKHDEIQALKNRIFTKLAQQQQSYIIERKQNDDNGQQQLETKKNILQNVKDIKSKNFKELQKVKDQINTNKYKFDNKKAQAKEIKAEIYIGQLMRMKNKLYNYQIENKDFQKETVIASQTYTNNLGFKIIKIKQLKYNILKLINQNSILKNRHIVMENRITNLQNALNKKNLIYQEQQKNYLSLVNESHKFDNDVNDLINQFRENRMQQIKNQDKIKQLQQQISQLKKQNYRLRSNFSFLGQNLNSKISKSIYIDFLQFKKQSQ